MKILVTGAAGFIGAATVKALLGLGHDVVGMDNLNAYYDTGLKYARLANAGISQAAIHENKMVESRQTEAYRFVMADLADRIALERLFASEKFDAVINLAGQAGVRYSIENPFAYVESNVLGFLNLLECCRRHPIGHLLYASSSSVYGMSDHAPCSEADPTDNPVSLYAATKKSDELMAYSYSSLYGIAATGMRFFTVYGPWGRPDMAPFIFLRSVLEEKPIRLFNRGEMERDFTYVDDIVRGVTLLLPHPSMAAVPHRIYNIGHSQPVPLMDFLRIIEQVAGQKAILRMEEMQPGDVVRTYADTSLLQHDFGYSPSIGMEEGIRRFYAWYRDFYKGGRTYCET